MIKARVSVRILLLAVLGLLGVAIFHGVRPRDRTQGEIAGQANAGLATPEPAGADPRAAGEAKDALVLAARKRFPGVRIQVVDGEGTFCPGIPVGLIGDLKRKDGLALDFFWQGRTAGVEGLVEVPAQAFSKVRNARISAFLLLPLARVVHAAIDPDSPGNLPVRLAIPPTGEVRIRVEMEGGLAFPAHAYIRLESRRPGQDFYFAGSVVHSLDQSSSEDLFSLSLKASSAKRVEEFPGVLLVETTKCFQPGMEELIFPRVGLGLELIASRKDLVSGPQVKGPGPRMPGEVVRLTLAFPAAPVLVGRLLDECGEPVADRMGLHFLCVGESWKHHGRFSTDVRGEFRLMLESIHLDARNVSITLVDDRGPVKRIACAVYPEPLSVGEARIGDLILEEVTASDVQPPSEEALLAEGRVVGLDGERPWSNATVEVFAPRPLPDQGFNWEVKPALAVRTGASGDFQIRGQAETAELMLRAVTAPSPGSGAIIASAPLMVPVGSKGLELIIGRGGVVQGSVMTDLGLQPGEIRFKLSFPGRKIHPWEITETASVRAFGFSEGALGTEGKIIYGFHFSGLGAGLATLAVFHVWDDRPLVVLEGIFVPPGAAANDPRLTAIDLRSLLRRVEVTIVDPTGKRSGPPTVAVRAGNQVVFHGVAWDIPLPLNVGPHPVDLYIEAPEFPPMLVPNIQGQRRIVLDPGQVVLLRLHGGSAQRLESPFRLEVGLERTGKVADEEWRRRYIPCPTHVVFDRNGEARLLVPSSGEHPLDVQLVFEGRGRLERLGIPVTPARVSAGMGVVELTPCPRALAVAIANLESR